MSEHHLLKTLLNIHLASDTSAALHLPFVLNTVTFDSLLPSPHLAKWTTRIQSLLHSKEPEGRWAGLVLAQNTAILSQELLLENGQNWVGVSLPMLSKTESPVLLKAAIRLLKTIFCRSHALTEFRRQVATPNTPKFISALISLAENNRDTELKVVAISTLVNLIPLYPTLHKASYPSLSTLALRFLEGNPRIPVPHEVLQAASRLYSIVHIAGGKVGASNLWRKSLDETLTFGTAAFWSLRSTFKISAPPNVITAPTEDPVVSVPLHLDRLRCAATILNDLLGATVYRPVQVPLGVIVQFTLHLLRITDTNKLDGFVDATTHILEVSVVSKIRELGCSLVVTLAEKLGYHLPPYLSQIMTVLAIQLEQQASSRHRHILLHTLMVLLQHSPSPQSPLIATQLMKAVLPSISALLTSPDDTSDPAPNGPAPSRAKKGKKKVQSYEGDELFSISRPIICPTDTDGKVLLTALEVVQLLIQDPHLSNTMQSISIRVLISILLVISRLPPAILSPDLSLYDDVLAKLQDIGTEFVSGTSGMLSKSLPLVVDAIIRESANAAHQRRLDLLLHPRLPPVVRSMPLVESLSIVFSEESEEEAVLRKSLGLYTAGDERQANSDMVTDDSAVSQSVPPDVTLPASPLNHLMGKPVSAQVASPPANPMDAQPKQAQGMPSPLGSAPLATHTLEDPAEMPPNPSFSASDRLPSPTKSQSTLKPTHVEAPISAPGPLLYIPSNSVGEDGDEEMPAIDMDSDSDIG